jgi:hypothetical protein
VTEERKMEQVWVELCRKGLNINVDCRVTIGKPDFDIAIQSLSALEIRYQRGLRKIADFSSAVIAMLQIVATRLVTGIFNLPVSHQHD